MKHSNNTLLKIWKSRSIRFFHFFFLLSLGLICACSESFTERCKREALEHTQRQCPNNVTPYLIEDSMVYIDDPAGFCYYNTLTEDADTSFLYDEEITTTLQEELLKAIRTSISMKPYKEHSLVFTYIINDYYTHQERLRFTVTPEDYQ